MAVRDEGSRRRATLLRIATCGLIAACLWLAPGPASGEPVRVFVVGHKQRIEDALTVATFRAKMEALFDARKRAPGLVQPGADDVASHLRPSDPGAPGLAVVHFPEDTGLIAGLIGSRGAPARAAHSSTEAFASLLAPYADAIAAYDAKFPGLADQPLRGLTVALTDVLDRSVYETFRDLARTYGVYVSVALNASPARRIESADDAARVALLRGPDEPERDYAYEATGALPHNMVWLFDPSGEILVPDGQGGLLRSPSETGGEILPSSAKAYLTPIEQTLDKPGGGLSLASARVRDLDVLDSPVGAIGVVISKDAWMPDVNERFDAKGASFTLQSEAFSSWAFTDEEWDPDVFAESGFGNLQSHAGFAFDAAPSMTGNLFEVTFDGQSAILEKRRDKRLPAERTPQNGWIGQLANNGFVAIAPWIVPDPPSADARDGALSLAARRRELVASGVKLLPGSGIACTDSLAVGACDNGYREAIVFADLDLPPGPGESGRAGGPDAAAHPIDRGSAPTSFGKNLPISPGGPGRQRHPRLAASGQTVAAVWDDTRDGPLPQIYLAVSRDGGAHFATAVKVSDRPAGERAELLPVVALQGDGLWVAWQAFESGADDDAGRIEIAHFDLAGRKRGADRRVDDGATLPPAGRWQPEIAILPGGDPFVAWIDERDGGPDGVALEHVYAARGQRSAGDLTGFSSAVRVDRGAPAALSESLDNKWAPTIAVDSSGLIHVAWTDFRDYSWDIYTARSRDGGRSFETNRRVNGGGSDLERICDSPRLVSPARGAALLAWTDIRARKPDTDLYLATSGDGGASFASDAPLDASSKTFDADRDVPTNQSHVATAALGGRVFAAWQDDREGNNDVFFSALDTGGSVPARVLDRVDDTGRGPSNQYRPDLAIAGDGSSARCVVAWEDDREGRLRVYSAARSCLAGRRSLPLQRVVGRRTASQAGVSATGAADGEM